MNPGNLNDRVAAYRGVVEDIASELAPRTGRGLNGVEWDDLVQEGLITVWQALERRITPSREIVELRMRSYRRWLGRSKAIPYEAMLPLDDFQNLTPIENGVGAGA